MRAIIIDKKDCDALLDKLKITNFESKHYWDMFCDDNKIPRNVIEELFNKVHGRFVYDVVGWLNSQGY
jgi:hypothetical protein